MPAQHLREALHENETVKASLRNRNGDSVTSSLGSFGT
jgi:hypothetical protein